MTTRGRIEGESPEYRKAREELLESEIALRDQRERVAALRRSLPQGPALPDYVFQKGPEDLSARGSTHETRLSELFERPDQPLILIHFMYGGAQKNPCPMCSAWADGYNAAARHLGQRANFAVVAEAEIDKMRDWARTRGWSELRFLSSADTSFKTDLKMQDSDGSQHPGVSVFTRDADGTVRHFYTAEAVMRAGEFRGVDLLNPVWHLLDLLPEGRGDFFPSLSYD